MGSKVLERNVCVSSLEIKAKKNNLINDHEVRLIQVNFKLSTAAEINTCNNFKKN